MTCLHAFNFNFNHSIADDNKRKKNYFVREKLNQRQIRSIKQSFKA